MSERSAEAGKSAKEAAWAQAPRLSRTYLEALRSANAAGAYRVAADALSQGMPFAALCQRVITPAMYELGRLWGMGAITVADEHMATALTHRVLAALRHSVLAKPPLAAGRPRAVLAAVEGEQHALGLRMAADLVEDSGYEAIYLGADVPTDALLRTLETLSPELLGLSATMPGSAPTLAGVLASVRGKHPRLSLLVGGQASASSATGEAPVDDLELLEARLRPV